MEYTWSGLSPLVNTRRRRCVAAYASSNPRRQGAWYVATKLALAREVSDGKEPHLQCEFQKAEGGLLCLERKNAYRGRSGEGTLPAM
eukprot:scaffold247142_cov17-Tisochrysis_lutea.AAC.1